MQIKRIESQLIIEPETKEKFQVYDEESNCIYEGSAPFTYKGDRIHPVFQIRQNGKSWYVSERAVSKTGIVNFRDLGGYVGYDNRQVKFGMLYRCAPVITKDEESLEALLCLHLKTILDLRSQEEALLAQDQTLPNCRYVQISAIQDDPTLHGNFDFKQLMQKQPLEALQAYMKQMYQKLPFKNPAYQAMFDFMKQGEAPLAFHCSAGKDRTGVAAYLILKALGVDEDTIMEDYLLSNAYRKEENEMICAKAGEDKRKLVMSLMEVQPSYLQAAIDAIKNQYDTFEAFLLQEYGITSSDLMILREQYLYTI